MGADLTAPARVAVIIAVRDGMPFIVEAVRSVLAQGPCLDQVIVVDDGSADGTAAAIAGIVDPRLIYIANPSHGVSSARGAGVAASRAEWLLFLDADDRLTPDALSSLTTAVTANAVAVYGDYERIDVDGRRIGRRGLMRGQRSKPSGRILPQLLSGNFIINGGILICRRDAYCRTGGFDPALALCEDWHMWCRLAALGPFVYVKWRVMDYRVHATSVMMHTRRTYDDFAPALRAIFSDPLIVAYTSDAERAELRSKGEASLMTYCAQQALRGGALTEARRLALAAMGQHPRLAPWILARLAGAMAGL